MDEFKIIKPEEDNWKKLYRELLKSDEPKSTNFLLKELNLSRNEFYHAMNQLRVLKLIVCHVDPKDLRKISYTAKLDLKEKL